MGDMGESIYGLQSRPYCESVGLKMVIYRQIFVESSISNLSNNVKQFPEYIKSSFIALCMPGFIMDHSG
jgi:hypothetical protein